MIRFKGKIAQIRAIEEYIIKNTTFINNDAKSEKENYSKAFIKEYSIYLHTEGDVFIQMLFELIPSINIKLWYDYRNYTAEIKIDTQGLSFVYKELPELRKMIKELDNCEYGKYNKLSKLQRTKSNSIVTQYI